MADGSIPRRDFLVSAGTGVAATMAQVSSASAQPLPASPATRPADLILKNANVITIDARSSVAEAIAIAGDKILAVGPDAAMAAHTAPGTRVLDLKGHTGRVSSVSFSSDGTRIVTGGEDGLGADDARAAEASAYAAATSLLGGVTTRRPLAGAEYANMEQSAEGRVAPQSSRSSHPDRYRTGLGSPAD